MKRQLDPFESKLKEKLQGKAQFPEEILWKRLNDELVRSDRTVWTKKSYWIIGTAVLTLLSLGTGYFIGLNQSEKNAVATNQTQKVKSSVFHEEENSFPKTALLNSKDFKSPQTKEEVSSYRLTASSNTVRNENYVNTPTRNEVLSSGIHSEELALSKVEKMTKLLGATSNSSSKADIPSIPIQEINSVVQVQGKNESVLNLLSINRPSAITHPSHDFVNHMARKRFPALLSASVALEPSATNHVLTNRVYGSSSPFTTTEKGLLANNVRLGFQSQFGRNFELGIGLGTSNYLTQQNVQNQSVDVDQLAHHIHFQSSVSSFDIHEDHLQDDPEDPEEHELNFQDSTEFHLNYQLSNTIRSVQIPLTAGYIFQFNKLKFSVKSGVILNHVTQANQLVNISGFNAIRTDIKSQLNINSYYHLLQLSAEYPISRHMTFMVSPRYTYALKSVSKSTLLRPNSLGLECALKFYF